MCSSHPLLYNKAPPNLVTYNRNVSFACESAIWARLGGESSSLLYLASCGVESSEGCALTWLRVTLAASQVLDYAVAWSAVAWASSQHGVWFCARKSQTITGLPL